MITDRLGLPVPGKAGTTDTNSRFTNESPGVTAKSSSKDFGGMMQAMSAKKDQAPSGPSASPKDGRTENRPAPVRDDRGDRDKDVDKNDGKYDSKYLKKQQRDDDNDVKQAVQARSQGNPLTAKQKAMLKFMDSMESELSVPPTRIVEALAQLNPDQLRESPDVTAPQVIDNLGLDQQDQERAQAIYASLLTDLQNVKPLQQPTMADSLMMNQSANALQQNPAMQTAAKQNAMAQYQYNPDLMPLSQKRAIVNQSLERMNQQFFMTPNPQQTQNAALAQQAALNAEMAQNEEANLAAMMASTPVTAQAGMMENKNNLANFDQVSGQQGPSNLNSSMNTSAHVMSNSAMKNANLDKQEALQSLMEKARMEANGDTSYKELGAKLAALGLAAKALNDSPTFKANMDPNSMNAMMGQPQLMAVPGMGGKGHMSGGGDFDSSSSGDSGFESTDANGVTSMDTSSDMFRLTPQGEAINAAKTAGASNVSQAQAPAMLTPSGQNHSNSNIQNLMNQAQYIMRKGGGEAIVKLNPEGLGAVNLKVQVHEGRVNVEMSTETKEAKKLIESSVSDLKNSLGGHKLAVDSIKVDVGNQASTDPNGGQKPRQDLMQDQSKEQARQFFSQFRDDQSSRGQFIEMPGAKAYQRTNSPDPLKPQPVEQARMSRYAGSEKGNGLNLVA